MTDTTDDHKSMEVRDAAGRFVRGPGRSVGSKNKVSLDIAKQISALGPRAVEALALALDERPVPSWAVQCVLKYVAPGRLQEFFGSTTHDVRQAFIDGAMTVDEMNTAASGLEKLKRVEEQDAVSEQLDRIEAQLQQKP